MGHPGLPLDGLFIAAVKACGEDAVLSHLSAAAHWGIVPWSDRRPEVSVTDSHRRGGKRLQVHRTLALDAGDRRVLRGVPLTSPARTLVDAASVLSERAQRRAVRQAQSLGLVRLGQIVETIKRLGHPRGTAALGRIVATGPAPTRSELEDVVLELILRGDLERPEINVPLAIEGRKVIPDFRWPAQKLVVEADGAQWHDNKLAREDDAERQALLEAHGEHVLRVTWKQAVSDPGRTLRRIREAGAPLAAHEW
ncbi:MAG: hypothetical protein QOG62_1272 [Thermoleophilaceae bacterium]|nr:hypothetical protein [Thermoleophilaceae bacterium]